MILKFENWTMALLCTAVLGSFGCSDKGDRPDLGTVTGTVTMDGEPVINLAVNFQPDNGRAASAVTDSKGHYVLEYLYRVNGAKIGPNKVYFEWPMGFAGTVAIPVKYSGAKSEIKEDVKPGKNVFDYDLESSGQGTAVAPKATQPID